MMKNMNKTTKVIVAGATGLLGVALAAGGAFAATAATADAPGEVLNVSGVAPAGEKANDAALENANENAKGLFGSAEVEAEADVDGSTDDADASAEGSIDPADTRIPTVPAAELPDEAADAAQEAIDEAAARIAEKRAVTVAPDVAVDVEARN